MKRSFGSSSMGGRGGNGGGGMIRRTLGRVVGVNGGGIVQGSVTKPTTTGGSNILSLPTTTTTSSSSSTVSSYGISNNSNGLVSASTGSSPLPSWHYSSNNINNSFYDSDIWDWESVDGDDGTVSVGDGFYERFVFGPVPSRDEVQDAVSSLQHLLAPASYAQLMGDGYSSGSDKDSTNQTSSPPASMRRVSSFRSEMDWIEPSLHLTNPIIQKYQGGARVYDAFCLLQNEPSIQRVVVSLSTDKAIWEAVLNNAAVRELRDSYEAENKSPAEGPAEAKSVLRWILDNSKVKLMEVIDTVTKLLSGVFQPCQMESDDSKATTPTDAFQEKMRSTLLLSIVVLLVVVLTRAARV